MKIKSIKFSINLFQASKSLFYISIITQNTIERDTLGELNITEVLYSVYNRTLHKSIYSFYLNYQEFLNSEYSPLINKQKAVSQSAVTVSLGAALLSNPAFIWPLINTLQMINYIPYNSHPMTAAVREILTTGTDYNILPNIADKIFSDNSATEPSKVARKLSINVSVFCINAGKSILMLIGLILFIFIVKIFSVLPFEFIAKRCRSYLEKNKYSQFFRFLLESCLDLLMFALIQLQSVNFI